MGIILGMQKQVGKTDKGAKATLLLMIGFWNLYTFLGVHS